MYAEGNGVTQDYSEALKWFRKAADQGNEVARRSRTYLESKMTGQNQADRRQFR